MIIIVILVVSFLAIWLFFRLYKPFGGRTPLHVKARSPQFKDGKFTNQIPTPMGIGFKGALSLLREYRRGDVPRRPRAPLVPETFDKSDAPDPHLTRLTWFGHSTFLLQIGGKHVLFDPMFGISPSPFPSLTSKRFSNNLPAIPEDLPHIDAVVISHDHYDHLDHPSILKLKDKVTMFFVPLGLGAHLRRWGVHPKQIVELDWWDEREYEGLKIACTPSRHFSGRTLTDRFATLWASWVVMYGKQKIYFSGDTGYGPHFKEIGKEYGPFTLALMECGQYDKHWASIHMTPEQTVQASLDLHAKRMLPMHWGAFVLALHAWDEPVERVSKAAKKAKVSLVTPKIGETVPVDNPHYTTTAWWRNV